MRRRTFLIASAGGVAALSGCTDALDGDDTVEPGDDDDGQPGAGLPDELSWEPDTEGEADATVIDSETLELHVHQCGTAVASAPLGEVSGTLSVSFDYVFEPEEWWEHPKVVVFEDGQRVYDTYESDESYIERDRGTRHEGAATVARDVDGDVTLDFRIEPSDACANPDHGDSDFEISNIGVQLD